SYYSPLLRNAHRLLEGAAHLRRLTDAVAERLEPRLQQRIPLVLLEGDSLDTFLLLIEGQLDAARHVRIADDRLRLAPLRHGIEIVEQALADHRDAEIAGAEILLGAVGDAPLPDPGDDVLVDHMAGDPAPVGILDRADPGRHALLNEGLAAFGHAHEE